MNLDNLPYSIYKIQDCKTEEDIFKLYPHFDNPIYKIDLGIPKQKALSFIVLLYSKGGLLLEYKDSKTAKLEAAILLGYSVINKKVTNKAVTTLLFGGSAAFTGMIVNYLRHQYSLEHSEICVYIESYYKQLEKLSLGDTDDEKTKDLLANIKNIKSELNKLLLEYSNGDNSKSLKEGILEGIEDERLELKPEDIAQKLRDKTLVFNVTPYGKGYNFKKYGNRLKINPHKDD